MEFKMSVSRFLVENNGPNIEAFKTALAGALQFSSANGINKITLVVSTKGTFSSTVIGEFFGAQVSKILCKGDAVDLGGGVSLNLETPRDVASHKNYGVVMGIYLSKNDMGVVDTIRSAKGIVYLPWLEEEGKTWLSVWSPIIWGNSSWTVAPLSLPTQAEQSLTSLSRGINLSTGLAHPSDKEAAKRMFSKLKSDGHYIAPEDIRLWAIKNGWESRHADDLGKLASKYFT
jgi:hypothetical protein